MSTNNKFPFRPIVGLLSRIIVLTILYVAISFGLDAISESPSVPLSNYIWKGLIISILFVVGDYLDKKGWGTWNGLASKFKKNRE